MNNIESIVKKIADDAKLSAEQKIAEAQQEAQQIVSDYQAQADKIMQDAQAQAQKQASVIAERVESQSGLIRRNLMLQYKREAIEQAFQKSLEVLCAQDADKQVTLLSDAAVKYLSADAKVILNEKDKTAFGEKLVSEISRKLQAANKNYSVSLSADAGSMQGGMILAEGSIETNLSYEILVKNIRDELEGEVAKVLTE
ncbi:V-type ATP synthase subunit E [Negativibacillus massiliensis]|uniref:V-type ATP synthase subunit E n=1 Tax=Negativibacillus massiliensis TaxID=1871035 RepID=UPI0023FA4A85|nr:V-type ATP synthase subunit E family protein [Negativibacillus massiliensis]